MKRKILLCSGLLCALAIVLTAVLIHLSVYRSLTRQMQQEVRAESGFISAGMELSGMEYLESLGGAFASHRITLIDRDGTVLFDSWQSPAEMENHLDRPEVQAAMLGGAGESVRFSDTLGKQTIYFARRLGDGTILRVSGTADSVFASLMRMIPVTLLIAAAVLVVAVLVSARTTRSIVEPINAIRPEEPGEKDVYAELAPLLTRIRQQKQTIDAQMEELRSRQKEFTAITDNMREGFLVLDHDAVVLSGNSGAVLLLQSPVKDPVHRSVWALNRSEAFRHAVEQALEGNAAEEILVLGERHCRILANPVQEGEAVRGAIIVLMDVTEEQEREKLRREFTANVSHELKTPLTAISGYAEIIANGVARQEDIPRFADSIYTEAQRMITLIGDIILLSRLDESDSSVTMEPVDLCALACEVAQRLKEPAATKGISISVRGVRTEIRGVRQVLDEMIFNLCDNAVRYNHEGGSVTVAVDHTQSEATILVTDTGIGIPPGEQDRIFERFYRVDKSRAAVEGTGLGLAIVRHGAVIHDARIEVVSDGVSGTAMRVIFPLRSSDGVQEQGQTGPA